MKQKKATTHTKSELAASLNQNESKNFNGSKLFQEFFLAHSPFTMGSLSVYYKSILSSFQILRRHYCLAGNLYFCLQLNKINKWMAFFLYVSVCVCVNHQKQCTPNHIYCLSSWRYSLKCGSKSLLWCMFLWIMRTAK